jgi:hypothetical protein
MNTRQLYDSLRDALDMNNQLLQVIEECLKALYPEDADYAICLLNEDLDFMHYNGCLQGLRRISTDMEERAKRKNTPTAI